jgi:hypothetical protein
MFKFSGLLKDRSLCSPSSFNLLLLPWVLLVFAASVPGQTALTGGLRGTATDKGGGALPGALVTVESRSLLRKLETTTDSSGRFTLLGLTPATDYEITINATGFKPETRGGVVIVSETIIAVDIAIEVRPVNETVNVLANDDATLSSTPEISQTIDAGRIKTLPANGRNLVRYALLDPHVRNTSALGGDGFAQNRLGINGNIYRETHHKLDGNANFDALFNNSPLQQVSIAAVQEFKVLTNQFTAEYGGTSAGFLVTTTKSGSNELHGEGFFFGRPSGIAARPPLATVRIPNQLLQYGGSIGGPIKKDKTFFFANYERTVQDRGAFLQRSLLFPEGFFFGDMNDHLALVKVDHRFSDMNTLAVRVNGNRNTNTNAGDRIGGLIRSSNAQVNALQNVGAQINHTMTVGKLINELRVSYINALPSNSYPLTPSVGVIRPGVSTEGFSAFSSVRLRNSQIVDQITIQFGRHVIRAGGDYVRQKIYDFGFNQFGDYRFSACDASTETAAQCLAKAPTQYVQRFGTAALRSGQTRFAAFVQDDWRATPKLTLNLGLRYDWQSILDDRNNFGPRIGFAYDPRGNGDTVIRGGVGVYYDQPFYHGYIQHFLLGGVIAPTFTYTIAAGDPAFPQFPNSLSAPPSGSSLPRRDLFLRGDNTRSPYTTQESFGVQQRIAGGWVATTDVIHHLAVKQLQPFDINAASPFPRTAPGQMRSVADADRTRAFTTYQGAPTRIVRRMANAGKAYYNALDLGLRRRFSERHQFEAHYVYSSAINSITDDHMSVNPNEFSDTVGGERGPSDFHQRHRFVANGTVALPWRTTFTTVASLASGLPVNAITGVDNNGDTVVVDRPVGFGRNAFRAPRQTSFDMSIAKSVALYKERARLEFRADIFDLFNGSNFYRLNNVYGNGATPQPTFLQPVAGVTNVDPGRQFQFGLRMIF